MNNYNGNYDSKLAYSVQRDYLRDAAHYRLGKTSNHKSSFGETLVSKLLPLVSYAIFFASLFVLAWSI